MLLVSRGREHNGKGIYKKRRVSLKHGIPNKSIFFCQGNGYNPCPSTDKKKKKAKKNKPKHMWSLGFKKYYIQYVFTLQQ